jgi:hypothetical protein
VYLYQINPFGWQSLSTSLIFPYAKAVSLIDCNQYGVSELLRPERFPQLERIYYLSGKPHSTTIHRQFEKRVQWIFPNYDYQFYNCMMEAGYGIKDNNLILSHILRKKLLQGQTHFDIHLPGYGPICGSYYQAVMYNHITDPHQSISYDDNIQNKHPIQCHPIQLYQYQQLELEFMKHITSHR